MSSQFNMLEVAHFHFKSQTPDVLHAVTLLLLLFHTCEPWIVQSHMYKCHCVSPLQSSSMTPAAMESDGIQATKCPKCQERASVKTFCSLSIQEMNSKGNLGARG